MFIKLEDRKVNINHIVEIIEYLTDSEPPPKLLSSSNLLYHNSYDFGDTSFHFWKETTRAPHGKKTWEEYDAYVRVHNDKSREEFEKKNTKVTAYEYILSNGSKILSKIALPEEEL